MGMKVDWDKVRDFWPTTTGFVCKSEPKGVELIYLWEFLPRPKARVWLESNIAYGAPYSGPSRPSLVLEHPTPPPSVQKYFLVPCRNSLELTQYRDLFAQSLECEAVNVAPGIWIEASAEYTQRVFDALEEAR